MSNIVATLNYISVINKGSDFLRRSLLSWEDQPRGSLSLILKHLQEKRPSFMLENLTTSLNCWEENPTDSLNFLLRSLDESDASPLENLRVAWANYSTDPKLAFHSMMKSLSEPIQLKQDPEFIENVRVGFVQLDQDPRLAFNLILKAIEGTDGYKDTEDLRKGFLAIEEGRDLEAINHFLRYLKASPEETSIGDLRKAIQKFPQANWIDAFSLGQLDSKAWLLEEWNKLNLAQANIAYILGGWYGLLPAMAEALKMGFASIYRSFDIDPNCAPVAETINKNLLLNDWKFKATTADMHNINYQCNDYQTLRSDGSEVRLIEVPDLIINTSCEHIDNFKQWFEMIPKGVLLVLQSNDFFEEETHINCSKSLSDFQANCPMSETLYAGEKQFPQYTRFMLIGRR